MWFRHLAYASSRYLMALVINPVFVYVSQLKVLQLFFFFFILFCMERDSFDIIVAKLKKTKQKQNKKTTPDALWTFSLHITDFTFLLITLFHFNCTLYTHFFHPANSPVGFHYGTSKGSLQICTINCKPLQKQPQQYVQKNKKQKTPQSWHILWQNRTFLKTLFDKILCEHGQVK